MDRRADLRGSLFMVIAMAAFSIEDALVKTLAATLPVHQILLAFGAGGAIVFFGYATLRGERLFTADVVSPPMLIRVAFEITGRLFYVLAIALAPLSSATVILQATPVVVVAAAALVFSEVVGRRRWIGIFIGSLGVVVVVRPGADGFSALSILAVIGMLGFAGRDLASRAAPSSVGTAMLGFYGFLGIVVAGALYAIRESSSFVRPDMTMTGLLLGAVTAGVIAYACLMKAMRTGDVSAVTPFRYTRLVFGVVLGVVVFGEALELSTIVGSGLVLFSGYFILARPSKG